MRKTWCSLSAGASGFLDMVSPLFSLEDAHHAVDTGDIREVALVTHVLYFQLRRLLLSPAVAIFAPEVDILLLVLIHPRRWYGKWVLEDWGLTVDGICQVAPQSVYGDNPIVPRITGHLLKIIAEC